nr:hypothetical protein [Morchella crassipes]
MKTTLKMLTPERVKNNERWLDNIGISPQCIYTNALLQKKLILSENKGKSGVYRWTNLENGNSYVGSSVNLYRRLKVYYSLSNALCKIKVGQSRICRSLKKKTD